MKALVSACLLGENCKYNGGNNYCEKLQSFLKDNNLEAVSFCPENLGGLPTPREPIEYANGKLIDKYGNEYTEIIKRSEVIINELIDENNIILAVCKAKSPSCGCGTIYDGTFTHTVVEKDGYAVEIIKKKGVKVITENDL